MSRTQTGVSLEYRVIWQREGLRRHQKRYARDVLAQRFLLLLGPEPWRAFGKEADALWCCYGVECPCGGVSWRAHSDELRKAQPRLLFARVESRPVGVWWPAP